MFSESWFDASPNKMCQEQRHWQCEEFPRVVVLFNECSNETVPLQVWWAGRCRQRRMCEPLRYTSSTPPTWPLHSWRHRPPADFLLFGTLPAHLLSLHLHFLLGSPQRSTWQGNRTLKNKHYDGDSRWWNSSDMKHVAEGEGAEGLSIFLSAMRNCRLCCPHGLASLDETPIFQKRV